MLFWRHHKVKWWKNKKYSNYFDVPPLWGAIITGLTALPLSYTYARVELFSHGKNSKANQSGSLSTPSCSLIWWKGKSDNGFAWISAHHLLEPLLNMHAAFYMSVITYLNMLPIHEINALREVFWRRVGKFLLKSIITLSNKKEGWTHGKCCSKSHHVEWNKHKIARIPGGRSGMLYTVQLQAARNPLVTSYMSDEAYGLQLN